MPETLPPARLAALLASARSLQQAAAAGALPQPLRGLNLGLLCEDSAADPASGAGLLRHAALALGAQVALVRPSQWQTGRPEDLQPTLRLLGRIYEALACEGLPAGLVQQIRSHAGVPVCQDLASSEHPVHTLAGQLEGGPSSEADRRCCLLQALLLDALR
ncbi:MAG TPA: ornithine carbamoyltransferase [Ideonella sp.]|uniref:ornithine carbamoyltransferase n=1 Tax=Ideonella sp. TaxID=1929293 RepID=UPI002C64F9CC|nr:ornithine carbamoyltransferase [Ideonella sp.]HSI49436.1 ornithine carbamoyltransferase [Ideonella sp.]